MCWSSPDEDEHATLKLMRKLLKKYAFVPEQLVTDDFAIVPQRRCLFLRWSTATSAGDGGTMQRQLAHQPTRRRERKMQRVKSPGSAQGCLSARAAIYVHLRCPTPSHLSPTAPHASRRGDGYVAHRGRSGLTIPEALTPPARCRQRDNLLEVLSDRRLRDPERCVEVADASPQPSPCIRWKIFMRRGEQTAKIGVRLSDRRRPRVSG